MLFCFEDYVLDTDRRELRRGRAPVAIQPQVFDFLEYLISHRERVVTRDDIFDVIWGGRIVSDSALTTRLNAVRAALGDTGEEQRLIRTLPRKGVRFVGAVREVRESAQNVAPVTENRVKEPIVPREERPIIDARRQLTVVSCELLHGADIARMAPDDLRDITQAFQDCVVSTSRRHDGFVAACSLANPALICFGLPVAHEDDTERAVRCGLELIAEVKALALSLSLQARVGIATGVVLVSELDGSGEARQYNVIGETTNLAARLQSIAEPDIGDVIVGQDGDRYDDGITIAVRLEGIAEPGGILISEKVYSAVVGKLDVGFEDRGEQQLKNISRPVRAYAVRTGTLSAPINRLGAVLSLPDKPSIAVLPFQNLSSDPEQEFFADGMVEEIITALSRFKELFVIARNSSFIYKGRAVEVKQVGRELGVRYALEGSVRKAANRVRITGQLIDAATGAHLWADRFDGGLGDIFDLQERVTERVVGAIAPAVETAEILRAKYKPTESVDAYDVYLQGLAKFYQYGNRLATAEALRLFNSAIEIDPDFALAYSHASHCYAVAKTNSWLSGTAKEIAEASRLARRALELSKDDASVLCGSGWTLALVVRDLGVGISLLDRALMLNSNLAEAWRCSGWMRNWLGDPDLAIEHFAHAMRLSPLGRWLEDIQSGIAHAHFFLNRYDEAASWAAMAMRNNPNFQAGVRIGAASDAMAGRLDEANETATRLQQLNPMLRVSNLKHVLGPYRRAEDLTRYEEGLRKAGLPE